MDTLKAVIEQAMKRTDSETPYALGVKIGTSRGAVSVWLKGSRWPSEKEAAKLAKLAGVEFGELITIMEMEKAKTPEDRAFWKRFRQHGIAASLALIGFAALPPSIGEAQAAITTSIHYAK